MKKLIQIWDLFIKIISLYGDKFNGFSAGSQPSGKINQGVLTFCKELGYPVEKLHSKSWDVFLEKEYSKIDSNLRSLYKNY